MLLKSLEIQGFKTFPDKTKLVFDRGITSVVGPNGSGKSNISDAIRWVLGEQSAKALRCSKMEDVVFNGTDNRKKVGFAEVTLTIDNTDRALPFDENVVAVTRRYFRSGDSEYLINKATVRLKDIHELFMDTGLGRDGYSMISQGKIDSIVSSKSEDRREIFEEASGISRYRYRKTEAERKLEHTEENLLRLRDILTELQDRVGPLEKQAAKAKSYLEYAKEKEGLEIAVWLDTIERSSKTLREHEDKISVARSQLESCEKALKGIEKESEAIYTSNTELTAKTDEYRRQNAELDARVSEIRAAVSVEENNIKHNLAALQRLSEEIKELDNSDKENQDNIKVKNESLKAKRAEREEKTKKLEKVTLELSGIMESDGRSSTLLSEHNTNLARLTDELSNCRVEKSTAESSLAEIQDRLSNINNSLTARQEQKDEYTQRALQCTNAISETDDRLKECFNTVLGYERLLAQKQKKRDNIKDDGNKVKLDINEIQRHITFLENLERNLEGFSQSVKVVVKESKKGTLQGIHGPVSRVIKVPSEYGVAIETALGAAMQNIVTETEDDAKRAIAFLKKSEAGRATFLPVSTIKGSELKEQGLDGCKGFIGIASTLCSCEDRYLGILRSLLGRICIASDLDCAVDIAKKYSYRFRVVTLDGQVVNAGGSLTGGSQNKKTGLLSRVSEIEKNKVKLNGLNNKINALRQDYTNAQSECGKTEAELISARDNYTQLREEKVKLEAELNSAKEQEQSAYLAVSELLREKEECESKTLQLNKTISYAGNEYERIEELINAAQRDISKLSGKLAVQNEKRNTLTDTMQNIKLEIVTLDKDTELLESEIKSIEQKQAENSEKRKKLAADSAAAENDNKAIEGKIMTFRAEESRLRRDAAYNNERITSLAEKRTKLEQRSSQLRQRERDKLSEKEQIGLELARLEERKENLNKQYDEINRKLWEEYELTVRSAAEKAAVIESIPKAQKRLSELKSKIKALGSVNVAAIDEYKEVSERYEFMKAQVGDIEKSKKEIIALIGDLTKQMKELFIERFAMINKNFGETFKELFGGGNASLLLTNEDDILSSGIDINCNPPGKHVSHLELLSGGERALVAIALYFAIMKVSPAPFCVMDEIEAALDEVNVDRFAKYLRRMTDNTQFILITHRRGTMEEADVLYGVTMQDEGISKLLELHSSEVAASFTNIK
ncbi:MAG: chromosome segregation protein SMC [Clostridia bacterium]|nr:chromosome segregation protein SMC [Clostridia bacterium]MBQ5439823.1 chromosome segregation protein SMC [Clostridia bacterium]